MASHAAMASCMYVCVAGRMKKESARKESGHENRARQFREEM